MKKKEKIKIGRKEIYCEKYETSDKPVAAVILVHGLGEHIERYERLALEMVEHRLVVYGFDHVGHGESSGVRGHTSVEELFKPIARIRELIKQNHPGTEIGIFGHSMGGLVVLRYIEDYPQDFYAAAVSAPAIFFSQANAERIEKNKLFARLFPFLTMENKIKQEHLSRNQTEVVEYALDRKVHSKISLKLALSMYENSNQAFEKAGDIDIPLLFLKGTGDQIVPTEKDRAFFDRLTIENKAFCEYEGAYHEVFFDPEHGEEFRQDIIGWFRRQL